LVEGVLFEGTDYPSARILLAATTRAFSIVLAEEVEREVRAALGGDPETGKLDRLPDLERLLDRCSVLRCPDATREQLAADKQLLWALLRHEPDAEIAVAFKYAVPRPNVIVSSNKGHWRPSERLRIALDGIEVLRPAPFLRRLGAAPNP
jgi:hypothetical protein